MIIDRYDPVNLFEMVPTKLRLEMEPELAALDRLLDDDEIFLRVKADLSKRRPNSQRLGRRSTPVEVILRMLLIRRLYNWSFEATERNVSDSLVLRQFCRLYLEAAPDDTTLIRWANLISAETLGRLNERAVALAVKHKATRGRKLRIDATVVEANISHPRDSALLSDGVRVLGRLVGRAKRVLGGTGELLFRNRTRSAKRLARRIEEGSRRREEEAKEALKATYKQLIGVASTTLKQAGKERKMLPPEERRGLAEELKCFEEMVERVVDQSERRVLKGQSVPAAEKLVSLFEPHTSIIRWGKAGKETEYGHKVWLEEIEGGIISGYRVLTKATRPTKTNCCPPWSTTSRDSGSLRGWWQRTGGCTRPTMKWSAKSGVSNRCVSAQGRQEERAAPRKSMRGRGGLGGGCALGQGSRGASACLSAGATLADAERRARKASVDG
jgi:transposase, IS5 family